MAKRALVLLILDGWGIGKKDNSNPIYKAQPANLNHIRLNYPAGTLQAAGIAVGLPWNEPGSSEVGHMTLGAGKVLYQDYPRISLAIRDGSFFRNKELLGAINSAKNRKTKVNLVGLVGESSNDSSFEHLEALVQMVEDEGAGYALHLFTDGKDSSPRGANQFLYRLSQDHIASLSGRFFAMDKDFHWERTKRCYDALVGLSQPPTQSLDIPTLLSTSYQRDLTDEFIPPTLLREDLAIKEGDSVIFFNFQEDGVRQITEMLVNPQAGGAPDAVTGIKELATHSIPENLHLVTLTDYGRKFNLPVVFSQERVINPLGKVLADAGKVQLRIGETEKYAHLTYFFDGMDELLFPNEYRVFIPSQESARVVEHPEMRARDIVIRTITALNEGIYDFILINLANPDAVAHAGNFDVALKTITFVDEQIGLLLKAVLSSGGILVVTSDHGNVEVMMDIRTGLVDTRHNTSSVPIYVVAEGYQRQKTEAQAEEIEKINTGVLSDVAPTILELMGVAQPAEMSGMSLLKLLR